MARLATSLPRVSIFLASPSVSFCSGCRGGSRRGLVAHCLSPEAGGYTASDFQAQGLSQSQIAGNLNTPASPLTQAVVTAANEITASICAVDGDRPDAVCASKGVEAADDVLKIPPPH